METQHEGFKFEVLATDPTGARLGRLTTPHGVIDTPAFMPVGTAGTVKGLTQQALENLACRFCSATRITYICAPATNGFASSAGCIDSCPGRERSSPIRAAFRCSASADLRKVTDDGVMFRSHLDGSEHFLTPEKSIEIEMALGSDIAMVFDECIESPAIEARARDAAKRTTDWARRSRDYFAQHGDAARQMLFGIVQGGTHAALRRESARAFVDLDFPGYAIGGLAVGEPHAITCEMAAIAASDCPRIARVT